MTIPPWLEQPNYIGAMSSGASIGLQRAHLEQQANEFAQEMQAREAARQQSIQERQQEFAATALRSAQQRRLQQLQQSGQNDYRNRELSQKADEDAYKMLLDSSYRNGNLNLGYDRLNQERQISDEKAATALRSGGRAEKQTPWERNMELYKNQINEGDDAGAELTRAWLDRQGKFAPSKLPFDTDTTIDYGANDKEVGRHTRHSNQTSTPALDLSRDENLTSFLNPGNTNAPDLSQPILGLNDNSAASELTNPKNSLTSFGGGVTNAPVKQFKDKTGNIYKYTGTLVDPSQDRNPDNWQLAQ